MNILHIIHIHKNKLITHILRNIFYWIHILWNEWIIKYIHFCISKFDLILFYNHSLTKSRGLLTNMAAGGGGTFPSLDVL